MNSRIAVKYVKSFVGTDGYGFNADLVLDGKVVAFVIDAGCGGDFTYQWKDTSAKAILEDMALAEPPLPCGFCKACEADHECTKPIRKDIDWLVSEAVDAFETEKKLKSWCKKKTVFRLVGDQKDSYRIINMIFSPKMKTDILKKYPGAEIINERFAKKEG